MSKRKPEITKEYMRVLRPCLHFHGIQIKSLGIFQKLAAAIQTIEEECGIQETVISMEEIFVCPDIDFGLIKNPTPTETLLIELIGKLTTTGNG